MKLISTETAVQICRHKRLTVAVCHIAYKGKGCAAGDSNLNIQECLSYNRHAVMFMLAHAVLLGGDRCVAVPCWR